MLTDVSITLSDLTNSSDFVQTLSHKKAHAQAGFSVHRHTYGRRSFEEKVGGRVRSAPNTHIHTHLLHVTLMWHGSGIKEGSCKSAPSSN